MNIEHAAYNVADPAGLAKWMAEHLGFRVIFAGGPPKHGRFLADGAGLAVVEFYRDVDVPGLGDHPPHPMTIHLALVSADPDADRARLVAAGAEPLGEVETSPAGDRLAMVRAPGGLPIQLVRRATQLKPRPRQGDPA
jgi:catechol 2,3-dioxygenase-like lactoylglutathione lyase family enzyme